MATWPVHGRIDGAIVMIGFGSIGRGTLPLIERHFTFDKDRFVVVDPSDKDRRLLDERGIRFVQTALTHDNYRAVLTPLLTAGGGLIAPSATALALQRRPEIAGSAAATLGVTRYGLGALAAPLVGAAGSPSTVSLGIVTLTCVVGAAIAWRCIPRTG